MESGEGRPDGDLWAGLLVGGRSRRMGRPKQLVELGGVALVERVLAVVAPRVAGVALLGAGEVPGAFPAFPVLPKLMRVADAPEVAGPMAGVLAALRFRPGADWVVVACDQPLVSAAAFEWLLAQRSPETVAVLPRLSARRVEPFFALYRPPALALLERLVAAGESSLQRLSGLMGVATPWPPPRLRPAWRDADTPAELRRLPGR